MADQIRHRSVTVPAGTPITSPAVTSIAFPGGDVERVDIYVPPGNAGLAGFRLAVAGQPVIPFDAGEFIIAEGERLQYPLEDFPDSGSWQFSAYNLDVNPHTFYITFLLKIVRQTLVVVGGPAPYAAPADTGGLGSTVTVTPVPDVPDSTTPPPPPEPDTGDDSGGDTSGGDTGSDSGDDGGAVDEPPPPPDEEPLPPEPADEPPPVDTTPEPAPEPEPPPPPPPPPPPQSRYAAYYGWQADGDMHLWHWYVEGPRAPQLVLVAKTGNYKPVPKPLTQGLRNQGWYDAASALPLGGKALYQKFIEFGWSD